MYKIFFGVLHIISILAVAKHATNEVAQLCKMLSCPSKCVLICRCKYKGKGHHVMSRVWTHPVMPGEVETQGSNQLDGTTSSWVLLYPTGGINNSGFFFFLDKKPLPR